MKHKFSGTWWLNAVLNNSSPDEARSLPQNIPMPVPGDVASALLNAHLIADPYVGRNELECLWIGQTDWSLSTHFTVHKTAPEERVCLDFERVDTVAEYYINKVKVGQSCNMFHPVNFDITALILPGKNTLEVIIRSPENFTAISATKLAYPIPHSAQFPWQWKHRNLLRKTACHGGWDWGLTLMTGGIYIAPVLQSISTGILKHWNVEVRPNGVDWVLTILLEYVAQVPGNMAVSLSIPDASVSEQRNKEFVVKVGTNMLQYSLTVHEPDLWWPNGLGEPKLYDVHLTVEDQTYSKRMGFRTVEVFVNDDAVGRSMTFCVNGRKIFAKGANWIPVDAFPARQTEKVYRRLLSDAVEGHMNMLRLWGGGQYEFDLFYDLCDELGLMVWHDMMFSCALYPANDAFLAEVEKEVSYQLKRLKTHPSIVLWCGNNEDLGALMWFPESRKNRDRYLVDYDRLNEGTVGRLVREIDPLRIWWPSSPSAGEGDYSDCWHDDSKGDMHYWSVWHEGLPLEAYYNVIPRFCSEFGFQSFPSLSTVSSYADASDWNICSPVMRHHQKHNAGNSIILETMARYFRIPSDFEHFLWMSQVLQAWAIQTAVEYWHSQRPINMGALYWQLNDLWPVASWSSIEYNGKWKLLHYAAKRFFAPIHLSLYKKDDVVHLVGTNDTNAPASGMLILRLLSFEGTELECIHLDVQECPADSAMDFFSGPLAAFAGKHRDFSGGPKAHDVEKSDTVDDGFTDRFLVAEWYVEPSSKPPIITTLFLTEPRDCALKNPEIRLENSTQTGEIVLTCRRPGFFVTLESTATGRFSDAGFSILPDHPISLHFISENGIKIPADVASIVQIRHLRGVQNTNVGP